MSIRTKPQVLVVDHPNPSFLPSYAIKILGWFKIHKKGELPKQGCVTFWMYGGNLKAILNESSTRPYYMQTRFKTLKAAKQEAKRIKKELNEVMM